VLIAHAQPPSQFSSFYSEQIKPILKNILEKIHNISSAIFHAIKNILSIPLRYLGSKTWSLPGIMMRLPSAIVRHFIFTNRQTNFKKDLFGSGYHHFNRNVLNGEEIKPYLLYAAAAAAIHSKHFDSWTKPLGFQVVSPRKLTEDIQGKLPQNFLVNEDCFFDPETGLKAAVIQKENRYLLIFGALRSSKTELDENTSKKIDDRIWNHSLASIFGYIPATYHKANTLVELIKEIPEIKSGNLELCGQCLGGSLVSYAGMKNQLKTTCLNTFPLGPGLQYELGNEKLKHADKYITHIICKTDMMSDLPEPFLVLDALVNFIGIKTFGNFGKKFIIPNPFPNYSGQTHNNIASAMFLHAGFKERDKPGDILHDPKAKAIFQVAELPSSKREEVVI